MKLAGRGLAAGTAGLGLFLVLLSHHPAAAIKWLGLAKSEQRFWNQTRHCINARGEGLIKRQIALCKQHLELMAVIAHATRESVAVCQSLFNDRRWNCSSVRQAPNYLADLTGGSREQAFVYALSSAALTQAVSRACSVGATNKCACGRTPNEPPPGDFKWGGCGDDLRFGLAFAEMFADSQWKSKRKEKRSKRAKVNVHNNEVGRKLVAESLTTACKCHGVSGSCSIKTCWKALPDLKTIGIELQKKYAIAVEVVNKKVPAGRGRKLVPVHSDRRTFGQNELVYYTKSPDYCLPDKGLGSVGTRGRECRKGSSASSGCRSMCCGRGFTTQVIEIKQRCDCKYYWCCYVKCKTCLEQVEINRCR